MKLTFIGLILGLSTLLQVYIDRRIVIITASEKNTEFQNYLNWVDRNSMQIEKKKNCCLHVSRWRDYSCIKLQ
ncbi:hypothetical protein ACFQ0R_10370 [Psychroflexus salinarum]|uniref:Uncharacterized protein n=1 Tax=Psychroflexus salinarum TaxID=546024 RepID=A0ABW3GWS4_9FLAO